MELKNGSNPPNRLKLNQNTITVNTFVIEPKQKYSEYF